MSALPRLVGLAAPLRWWVLLAILLNAAALAAGIALMSISAYLISKAALVSGFSAIALAVAGVRGFAIARAAFRYAERYTSHAATFRILTRLRVWFYTAIEPAAPAGLRDHTSGDLLSRIATDVEGLSTFYVRVLVPPLGAALALLFAAGIVGAFDLRLALLLLGFFVLAAAVPVATRRLGRESTLRLATVKGKLNAALTDELQGMPEAVAFGRAEAIHAQTRALSDEVEHLQQRLAFARGLNGALTGLIAGVAGLTILLLAIPLVGSGGIDAVYLAILPLVVLASFEAVQQISTASEQVDSNRSAAHRLFELIDTQDEVRIRLDPPSVMRDYTIEFRNVCFGYDEGEPPVLDGVSFRIPSGGRMAIDGPSGSGKTTIANLLLRFWDCRAGEILIGGQNIAEYDADDIRRLIGIVPQNVFLFSGTVRDNLLLGKGDAADDEIAEACRRARIDGVIDALPQGFDTLVGENGHKLSGGERQRLAIARAMLKDAPILILDEATTGLDWELEQDVLHALDEFMTGRTTIVVSHDKTALALAGAKLVLA